MIVPTLFSFFLFFYLFSFCFSCGYLGLWLFGWSIWRWNLGLVKPSGLWSPYSSLSLLVVFLALWIFVVGGVAYVHMHGFLVDRVKLCFGFVCEFIHICVLFRFLYFVFLFLCVASRSPTRTLWDLGIGGSRIPFLHIFLWNFFRFCIAFLGFRLFVPFLSIFAWLLVCI